MNRKVLPALAAVLGLMLGAASADAASRARAKAEPPPPPPPPFHVGVATKSVQLVNMGTSMPPHTILGTYAYETLCLGNILTVYLENAFSQNALSQLSKVFAGEANIAGYKTPGGSGDLFKTQDTQKAEMQVGVIVAGLEHTGCMSPLGASGGNAVARITIDWQVFEPLEQKIVLRTRTQGTGRIRFDSQSQTLAMDVTLVAFAQATKALLSSPEFVAVVADPRGGPAGAPTTDLFPQAHGGSQSAATVQVANLPLRAAPFREQVSDLQKHVVTVRTAGGTGTGFYIADGLLLTNQHVISGVERAKVRFLDGREISADVIASDMRRDVALLKTESVALPGLALRRDKPELSSPVFVIGSPLGQENEGTISSGIVSAFRTTDQGPMIQSDAAITSGNSGGPMFDDKGNVVAITVSMRLDRQGDQVNLNFFIPIADALEKLHIQPTLQPGAAPMLAAVSAPAPVQPQVAALTTPSNVTPGQRQISVQMYPAAGPVKDGGYSAAIAGVVAGVGTSGTFSFARPDSVTCNGRWTTLQSKPQSGSLVDKHQKLTGLPATVSGMVGGLAIGACSNSASFQAEYYAVPGADSGFGVATDSDGNIYKLIF